MKKIMMTILCLVVVFGMSFSVVEAGITDISRPGIPIEDGAGSGTSSDNESESSGVKYPTVPGNNNGQTITGVTNLADRIWATAITIIQALAIGCVVFAGLRYMYASADKKADIKKGMMYLAIGSIFVFAATTVIRFIYNAGIELL